MDTKTAVAIVAAVLSLVSIGLSIANFVRSTRLDKRDLFLRLHGDLIAPEIVAGRRVLYGIRGEGDARFVAQGDVTSVYRALAMFDVLGLYVEKKWIDEEVVLAEWGDSLRRSRPHAEHFMAVRREMTNGAPTWPHYVSLSDKAIAAKP